MGVKNNEATGDIIFPAKNTINEMSTEDCLKYIVVMHNYTNYKRLSICYDDGRIERVIKDIKI